MRGKKEFWHLRGHPQQLSLRSCAQAGRTLLSRGEGRRGEAEHRDCAGRASQWGPLSLGLPRPLSPRQGTFQRPPDSKGKPVEVG